MHRVLGGNDLTQVPLVGAGVKFAVAVEGFFPQAGFGQADAVAGAEDGGKIQDDRDAAGPLPGCATLGC